LDTYKGQKFRKIVILFCIFSQKEFTLDETNRDKVIILQFNDTADNRIVTYESHCVLRHVSRRSRLWYLTSKRLPRKLKDWKLRLSLVYVFAFIYFQDTICNKFSYISICIFHSVQLSNLEWWRRPWPYVRNCSFHFLLIISHT